MPPKVSSRRAVPNRKFTRTHSTSEDPVPPAVEIPSTPRDALAALRRYDAGLQGSAEMMRHALAALKKHVRDGLPVPHQDASVAHSSAPASPTTDPTIPIPLVTVYYVHNPYAMSPLPPADPSAQCCHGAVLKD
jgi:hypothetical protein